MSIIQTLGQYFDPFDYQLTPTTIHDYLNNFTYYIGQINNNTKYYLTTCQQVQQYLWDNGHDQYRSHHHYLPVNMFLDALRWNILNIIRVELFFNCYKLWDIFINSSLKSPRGQYAIASFVITFLAHFTVQFDLSWLLTVYSIYLLVGVCVWIHRRVYFYHRRLDSYGINQTINQFDASKQAALNAATAANNQLTDNYATLNKKSSSNKDHHRQTNGSTTASVASSAPSSSSSAGEYSNSLQRQRASAYRDFRSLLAEPRRNHREFAMSLVHLSNISKLVADKDVFDEMHFQILATRRDVVNILLRAVLIGASSLLAYMR